MRSSGSSRSRSMIATGAKVLVRLFGIVVVHEIILIIVIAIVASVAIVVFDT